MSDLFSNPMVDKARETMTPEELEKLKREGENMFSIDYENERMIAINEIHEQLKIMLRSGIHPSFLTEEEKSIFVAKEGKEWYENYGFLVCDLQRINF